MPSGVISKLYDVVMDSILQEQQVIDGNFDSTSNTVTVLSGNERIYPKGHFSRGKYQDFQIRKFNVNLSNDSLIYESTITISPNQMKDTTLDYSPIRMFMKGDNYYVVGKTVKKNFQYPFIAEITTSGKVNDVWVSDSGVAVNSATFSADSSKIAFCGYTNSFIAGTKYYSFNICEFDLNSKEFSELTYATDLIDKKLTSIQPYKNGDYAVTGVLAYPYTGLGFQPSYAVVARITHTPTSTGDNQPSKTNVNVTPNPSTEMATVEFESSPEASTIQLVDVKGNVLRTLYQKTTQNTHQSSVTFRVSDLANGMYYVVVGNGTKTLETVPLSIQR
ncbi:MAG: T9SS type A sorting domain-containing protein [Candidatus Kapabacteria bacterium]|nr:T9SS type A sorting domain-containing protein [Candidatus Kapabacteria bacterium]